MSTYQAMRFKDGSSGDSIDFSESFSGNMVRVYIGRGANGYVDFNKKQLRELRKWASVQLSKMSPEKK